MSTMQPYSDMHQPHIASAGHAPTTGPPSLSHYGAQQYQQSSIIPPQHSNYGSQPGYSHSYSHGGTPGYPVSSSMNGMGPLPAMATPATSLPQSYGSGQHQAQDQTGQVAPAGMKPRVTATLWEDEGSLCFQVEAKGVCVARREDNSMINGTKLLNVAGMTRGRRDGILKSEKTRHVVKIGPMHLKGVWIPYERALDFANKEKITELLYPLFVRDIGALLYHPSNQTRSGVGSAAMAAVDQRRRPETQRYIGAPAPQQTPSLTHHHSMSNPVGASPIGQSGHGVPSHPGAPRPGIDRAHTFPTPPQSATSMVGMGNQPSSYDWNNQAVSNVQGSQPLSIDTGISATKSVPTTPASTPPGAMGIQYGTASAYDGSRPMYSAPPGQQAQYSSQAPPVERYSQPMQYSRNDMAPPARSGAEQEHQDTKPTEGIVNQPGQSATEEEPEHEGEYTHSGSTYGSRGYYNSTAPVHSGHAHLPEMNGSPAHQNGSGRATPRTTTTGAQWDQGYNTPRAAPPATSLMNVMSNESHHSATNGAPVEGYQYPSQAYSATNGASSGVKRSREDEEDQDYARHRDPDDIDGLKRRKTINDGSVGSPYSNNSTIQRSQSTIQQRRR